MIALKDHVAVTATALSIGAVAIAALILPAAPAIAGAKGPAGAYGAPSPQGRVVLGTVPGQQGRGGYRRHRHNRVTVNTGNTGTTGLGPRNYYFERGTGIGQGVAPNMPSVYFNVRTRQPSQSNKPRRVHRAHQPVRSGLTVEQVRRLTNQLPPRQRNNIIDPRSPAAQRESSGIRFGPSGKNLESALASRKSTLGELSGRNLQGYRQGAPRHDPANPPVFDVGHHHGNQYLFAHGTWYQPANGRLYPALPPVGLTVPHLPNGFTAVTRSGRQYFAADGVYLREYGGGYVVVESPAVE